MIFIGRAIIVYVKVSLSVQPAISLHPLRALLGATQTHRGGPGGGGGGGGGGLSWCVQPSC